MQKTTVLAHSDIALIKYWGKKDKVLRLPANGSLSLILDALQTTTTVAFDVNLGADQVQIDGAVEEGEKSRVIAHLQRIRDLAKQAGLIKTDVFARVMSVNNFPKSTGLSSSSSGFAALTIAASQAIGLQLDERGLSILSRQGSGSSCRCVCGGIVEWLDGDTSDQSYAVQFAKGDVLPIRDLVTIVAEDKKQISSTEGHDLAETSPFFAARQQQISTKLQRIKQAIQARDFITVGEIAEAEALEFHSILLTSQPNIFLLYPGTVEVIHLVRKLRSGGIPVYFTINTGFNVHVLTLPEYEQTVLQALKGLSSVHKVLASGIGDKPQLLKEHLF